jgi:hypothetical protein
MGIMNVQRLRDLVDQILTQERCDALHLNSSAMGRICNMGDGLGFRAAKRQSTDAACWSAVCWNGELGREVFTSEPRAVCEAVLLFVSKWGN